MRPLKTLTLALWFLTFMFAFDNRSAAQVVESFDKVAFLSALPSPTTIDFDSLPPNGTVAGTEFTSSGLVITHLDGKEINVISSPPIPLAGECAVYISSGTNAISSSYATTAKPGYTPGNCSLWFNNGNSDNIRFSFTTSVSAAGIYFAENDVAGLTVQFFSPSGDLIYSRYFPPFSPHSSFFGIRSSSPIGSMEVLNAAGDNDGLSFDDVVFQVLVPLDMVGPVTSSASITPTPLAVNTVSSLSATVDDSTTGGSKVASAYYSVNGSTSTQMLLTPSAVVTTQATATLPPFSQSNVYNVCVHGIDVPGNTGADTCVLLPIYDPNGGFVTGGGQVVSPAGADLLNTSAAGAATFGFVSKYLPGRNTPSGNLEFQFKEGSLNFKSTSMDWLVVTGQPRAIFRGTGTINGTNICKFEVDAWDGSFTGNADAFGLKIFSCASGGDRYSLPATILTKGNVIIHN